MACLCSAVNGTFLQNKKMNQGQSSNRHDVVRFSVSIVFFAAGIVLETIGFPLRLVVEYNSRLYGLMLSTVLFIAAWASAGFEVLENTLHPTGKRTIFDENFLMSFATIGAFILGDWMEGAAVMLFYNLGELLQAVAVRESRHSIVKLMDLRPDFVRLYGSSPDTVQTHAYNTSVGMDTAYSDKETCYCSHTYERGSDTDELRVSPCSVRTGTLILVKAGEKVPLDGVLEKGMCSFDTASITGESIPLFAKTGTPVLAGFVNLDGLAVIRTTATAENTAAAKMLALVEKAQNRKAKTERLISSFARTYTPLVTAAAVLLAVVPPLFFLAAYGTPLEGWKNFVPWISRGLVFLVISCPCAFVISVPLGYFAGLGGAAKKGILIKGADFIDTLAKTKCVIFDKTGTLTEGFLTVQQILLADGVDHEQLLKAAYCAEYYSSHPIAQTVKQYAEQHIGGMVDAIISEMSDYCEKAGKGVTVQYRGSTFAAGSPLFIFGSAENIPPEVSAAEGVKAVFSENGVYIGCVVCNDSVKKDTAQAIKDLRASGVSYIEMLTGDGTRNGEKTAQLLGLDRCSCRLLPHEKVERFEVISAECKHRGGKDAVCVFVGDGVNDAPVLARADVGIAMGGIGSDAAIEAADVVLMNDNPRLIALAIQSARVTRKIVKQNIILAFVVKISFLALGAFGVIGLWAAVFADVGVAVLAVCNSLRARR